MQHDRHVRFVLRGPARVNLPKSMLITRTAVLTLLAASLALAADPLVGTWKSNAAKSPSNIAYETVKWEAVGKDHYLMTRVTVDGKTLAPDDRYFDRAKRQRNAVTTTGQRIDERHLKTTRLGFIRWQDSLYD